MLNCNERDQLMLRQVAILEEIFKSLQRIEAKLEGAPHLPRKVEVPSLKPVLESTIPLATGSVIPDTEPLDADATLLCEALQQFGIAVDQVRRPFGQTEGVNQLATYVGERWECFRELWLAFKHGLQGKGGVTKKLAHYASENISHICNLCTRLKDFAFLSSFNYKRAPHCLLQADVSLAPHAQAFIGGEWFERFLLVEVQQTLAHYCAMQHLEKRLRYLNDTVIVLPDQKGAELDLFCEVDGLYFWLEAKTGDYQRHIEKYDHMAKLIGLPQKQVMLVILDLPEQTCRSLSGLYSHLTILNQHMVRAALMELFCNAFGALPETVTTPLNANPAQEG